MPSGWMHSHLSCMAFVRASGWSRCGKGAEKKADDDSWPRRCVRKGALSSAKRVRREFQRLAGVEWRLHLRPRCDHGCASAREMRGDPAAGAGAHPADHKAARLPSTRDTQIPGEGTLGTWLAQEIATIFTKMQTLTVEISQTHRDPAESTSLTAHTSARAYQNLAGALRAVQSVDAGLNHGYCCWQDVVDAIETAKARDQAKADKSFIRAGLRKSGAQLGVLESLTNMIPDQDGLSILRGGMMTVLKVCTQ